MSNDLTLRISVKNLDDLKQLKGLVNDLKTVGPGLKSSLSEAGAAAKSTSSGFEAMATSVKTGFASLQTEIVKLNAGLKELGQALKTAAADDGGASRKRAKALEDETVTVRKLKEANQQAYEARLKDGKTAWSGGDLRQLQAMGVSLSPQDRLELDAGKKELSSLEELAKQKAALSKKTEAEETAAAQRRAALILNSGKLEEQAANAQRASMLKNIGFQVGMLEQRKAAETANENAQRQSLARRTALQLGTLAQNQKMQAEEEAQGKKAFSFRTRLQLQTLEQRNKEAAEAAKAAAAEAKAADALIRTKAMRIAESGKMEERDIAQRTRHLSRQAALNAQFMTLAKEKQQLQKALTVQAFLAEPGATQEMATARFGGRAVSFAQDAQAMKTLQASIEATEKASKGLTGSKAALTKESLTHQAAVMKAADAYSYLHTSMRGVAGGMGAIWLTWGKPMTALWAGFAVSTGIKQSIQSFIEFENQLKLIQGVSGESAESVKNIGDAALELGRSGIFGPQQVAEGLRILTQAGLTAADSLKVIPNVMSFATVGEMNLDKAAQSLIGISTAFGQPIELMGRVGDVVAKAAAISQTSIEGMTAAVRVSSVVAEQFGAKIEDVSAILAVMAKRNIESTAAGTALRNAYKEIYTPTDKARAALKQLGIEAYDAATGKMKPFLDVMGELGVAMQSFDKQSQDRFFQIIFGERGGKAGSALLNDVESLRKASKALAESSGFVDNAALIIESSVKNRMIAAMNNLKSTFIEAGAAAEGPMRTLAATFNEIANNQGFQNALANITSSLVTLVQVLVQNAGTIAQAFLVWLGVKAVAAVAGLAVGLKSLAGTYGVVGALSQTYTLITQGQTVAMNNLAAAAQRAAAAQGAAGLAGSTAAAGGAAAGALSTFGRFIPVLGTVITLITSAALAWDFYKAKQDGAKNSQKQENEDVISGAERRVKDANKMISDGWLRLSGGDPEMAEASNALDARATEIRTRMAALQERMVPLQKRMDDLSKPNATFKDQQQIVGLALRPFVENAPAQELKAVNRELGELQAQLVRIDKVRQDAARLPKSQQDLAEAVRKDAESRLKTGTKTFTEEDTTRRASSRGLSTAGTLFGLDLSAMEKEYDRAQQIFETMGRNKLITEETLNAETARLQDQRFNEEYERAQKYLGTDLPRMYVEAMREISGTDAEAEDRRKAVANEYVRLVAQATAKIEEATEKSMTRQVVRSLDQQGKANARTTAFNASANSFQDRVESADSLKDIENGLRQLPFVQQEVEKRRIELVREAAQTRKEIERLSISDPTILALWDKRYAEIEKRSLESAKRRAEFERSFQNGATRAAKTYIDDVENMAAAGEKLVATTTNGIDNLFVDMAQSGKLSFKSLADAVVSDLIRMATQVSITAPLMKALFMGKDGGLFGQFLNGMMGGSGMGGFAGETSTMASAMMAGLHSGGMVGSEATFHRSVPISAFAGASRYHSGGLVKGEVPIIAQEGEMVLTKGQQQALGGALSSAPQVEVNVINNGSNQQDASVDTRFDGKKMIVNVILEDLSRNGPISKSMASANKR